jgi:hypothetical protein
MVSTVGETANLVLLLDPDGNVTWWHQDTRGLSVFRALATHDGQGVVYASAIYNGGPAADSALVRVPWDGSSEEAVPVPNLAHDFVEKPDGTVVAVNYVTQDDILGSGLVQIDRDGATTQLWTTWDCLDPVANPGDDPEHGWTHANALDYVPDEDAYLVGLRNLGTILRVDADGTCPWGFGGSGGTVTISGPRFIHEHQFEKTDGGLLVFDNDGAPGNESRALEYAFDEAAGTASLTTTFSHDPPLYSFIMGDVHRLPDDDTLVLFSVPHTVDRFGPDGVVKWSVELGGDALLGFFQPLASPYEVP